MNNGVLQMIKPVSPLSAFIFSDDSATVQAAKKVLASHRFRLTTLEHATAAADLCRRTRYDLAIYDEDYAAENEKAASASPNAPHVVIRLVGPNKVQPFPNARFHFVIQKPFTADLLAKTVRAAYGLIAVGRRSTFRQEVSVEASSCRVIHQDSYKRVDRLKILNVSYMGMCVETSGMLPQGAQVDVSFPARELGTTVNVTGTVVWSHVSGRAGLKLKLGNDEERAYETWLASILPGIDELLPAMPHQPWHSRQLRASSSETIRFQKGPSEVVHRAGSGPQQNLPVAAYTA
jgi:hypothetical protein